MKDVIKKIIIEEFENSLLKIEKDFKKNLNKKINNFLLDQFDENIIANMVFVSSFESKSGNAIEKVARKIAELRFGKENVPMIVNPNNLSHNIDETNLEQQIIVTNVDISNNNKNIHGEIKNFMTNRCAKGKGRNRQESVTNQETIKDLLQISNNNLGEELHIKPVDLAFIENGVWNLMEIKAGGDLDSSNAPSNITKLLTLYVGLNYKESNLYFSTIYNKNGEGKKWTGVAKNYLNFPSMFLIGSQFWERILPTGISFNEFTEIYKNSLTELDLNNRINAMITNRA